MNHMPWHGALWEQLCSQTDRLAHALLFMGPAGIGKRSFANAFAARMLCERASGALPACGACAACGWFAAGNHPDFRVLNPEGAAEVAGESGGAEASEEGKAKRGRGQIVIAQMRALRDFVGIGTHRGGWRVVLVEPAEAMNRPTANALLKLLEEPTPSTLFLLVSDAHRLLLPTIRSRCRTIAFGKPDAAQAQRWLSDQGVADAPAALAGAGGAPLAALALERQDLRRLREQLASMLAQGTDADPLACAAEWESWLRAGVSVAMVIDWMQRWLADLASVRLGGGARYYPAQFQVQARLAGSARSEALLDCYNALLRRRRSAEHPLNTRLLFEDIALRYRQALGS